MKLEINHLIHRHALEFKRLAEVGYETDCRLNGMTIPFICCQAFAIELMLKSLSATSHDEVDMMVGKAVISKEAASPEIRGHDLVKLFDSLPIAIRAELADRCDPECRTNHIGESLRDCLEQHCETFVKGRYLFETPTDNVRFNFGLQGIEEMRKLVDVVAGALSSDQ
jgi:hypothetical protein